MTARYMHDTFTNHKHTTALKIEMPSANCLAARCSPATQAKSTVGAWLGQGKEPFLPTLSRVLFDCSGMGKFVYLSVLCYWYCAFISAKMHSVFVNPMSIVWVVKRHGIINFQLLKKCQPIIWFPCKKCISPLTFLSLEQHTPSSRHMACTAESFAILLH